MNEVDFCAKSLFEMCMGDILRLHCEAMVKNRAGESKAWIFRYLANFWNFFF